MVSNEVSRVSVSSKNDVPKESQKKPVKKGWCGCFSSNKKSKHEREFTQWEIDYAIQLRAKRAFAETDRKGS